MQILIFHITEWKQSPKTSIAPISRPRILLAFLLTLKLAVGSFNWNILVSHLPYNRDICLSYYIMHVFVWPARSQGFWSVKKTMASYYQLSSILCVWVRYSTTAGKLYAPHTLLWPVPIFSPVSSFYTLLVQTLLRIPLPYSFHKSDLSTPWPQQLPTILSEEVSSACYDI